MPDPLPITPPVIHPANITGALPTTIGGAAIGIGQYLTTQGVAWPHDAAGWIQFAIGLVVTVLGAFGRMPTSK